MTKDEALKRGMELLRSNISAQQWFELQPEITAIKDALAQPENGEKCHDCGGMGYQDGIGDRCPTCNGFGQQPEQEPDIYPEEACDMGLEAVAYYTTPPKREWVGLTYEDMVKLQKDLYDAKGESVLPTTFAMAVEAKLRSKNT